MKILWFLASIGGIFGLGMMILGFGAATSAPQEAAATSMAVAAAVIPYVLVRCFQLFGQAEREADRHAEILSAIRSIGKSEQSPPVAVPAPTGIGSGSPRPQAPPGA